MLRCRLLAPGAARAALISVDWNPDGSADGLSAGTLGGIPVSLVSTDGPTNGGVTFDTNWATNLGSNDVPGIGDAGVVSEGAALDWLPGEAGIVTITFGSAVTDPILLFNFTDVAVEAFDFADAISIALLDANPPGTVTVAPGNVVTTSGGDANTANDGFSIQLSGAFTSIQFATNVNLAAANSVGFSVATEATAAVPEPSAIALLAFGLIAAELARRRRTACA